MYMCSVFIYMAISSKWHQTIGYTIKDRGGLYIRKIYMFILGIYYTDAHWNTAIPSDPCRIRKIDCGFRLRRVCRERFPRNQVKRKPLVSDPGMLHSTCVTRMPWRMSGSLTRGGGENVPGIPDARATRNFAYLVNCPLMGLCVFSILCIYFVHCFEDNYVSLGMVNILWSPGLLLVPKASQVNAMYNYYITLSWRQGRIYIYIYIYIYMQNTYFSVTCKW